MYAIFFFNFSYRKKHGIVTGGSYSSDYVNTIYYYYFFKFNILVIIKFPYSIKGCQNYPFFPCYQPKTKGSIKSKCPKSENTLLECRHTCRTAYNKSYKHDLFYGTLTRNTSHSIAFSFLRDRSLINNFELGESVYRIPNDVQAIQLEILENGPVQANLRIYEDFLHYKTGWNNGNSF